mmetsp:Transcript_28505/g.83902  ORF Transcript_28505/g.83902 Transcript_28505/m.83902 type:complete len:202 (-) Transcript_28505:1468-2073(-)
MESDAPSEEIAGDHLDRIVARVEIGDGEHDVGSTIEHPHLPRCVERTELVEDGIVHVEGGAGGGIVPVRRGTLQPHQLPLGRGRRPRCPRARPVCRPSAPVRLLPIFAVAPFGLEYRGYTRPRGQYRHASVPRQIGPDGPVIEPSPVRVVLVGGQSDAPLLLVVSGVAHDVQTSPVAAGDEEPVRYQEGVLVERGRGRDRR